MSISRLVTGVILGLLSLWAIFGFSQYWFAGLIGLFILLAAWELAGLAKMNVLGKIAYLAIMIIACIVSVNHLLLISYIGGAFWVLAFLLLRLPMPATRWLKQPLVLLPIGLLMLVPYWTASVWLHGADRLALFYVFMLVTLSDTGAYYVGKSLGKHKMSPQLSPKKTYEGLAGGLIVASIAGIIISCFMPHFSGFLAKLALFGLGILIILGGAAGDLFESLLKRQADVKDSGTLLPGHGGVLDRLDSLSAALPIAVILLLLIR